MKNNNKIVETFQLSGKSVVGLILEALVEDGYEENEVFLYSDGELIDMEDLTISVRCSSGLQ
jgi:hypothetical protein|tara:strand:- start:2642 stop:2827 length:186 start_codon:yes stop_codon:yes gene_type:complete